MSYEFLNDAPCEKCTSLLGQEGAYSAECFSDIPASVLSRLNLTVEKSCFNASETESCQGSQSGMTCEPSMEIRGEEKPMSCVVGSHARILAPPGKALESKENEVACGKKWPEWFAKLDPRSSSWKIPQCSLFEDSEPSLEIWPRWGMMRGGECFLPLMLDCFTAERGFTYLPTPSGTSNHGRNHVSGRLDEWGGAGNPWRKTEIGKVHCADFEEWIMGWPVRWTELTPYDPARFQQWLNSHGKP